MNFDDPRYLVELCLKTEGKMDNLPFAERAIAVAPDSLAVKLAYGVALHHNGKLQEAVDILTQAAAQNDGNEHIHKLIDVHRAMCLHEMGNLEEADKFCQNDTQLAADTRAHILLMRGRFQEGFACYKDGVNLSHAKPLDYCSNEWEGGSLAGKRVVLYRGGGFGDYFMFARFFHLLKDRFHAKEVMLCGDYSKQEQYMVYPFVKADGVIGVEDIRKDDILVCDYRNMWKGVTDKDVLEHAAQPYMKALVKPELERKAPFCVGIVWQGNAKHAMNRHRSISLSTLAPLFAVPCTAFYSFQVDGQDDLAASGMGDFITDVTPGIQGWRDTAGYLAKMDMIVSIDSGLAHLAGALGVPTLLLNYMLTDWRWNRRTERTIWYKNHRIIHQQTLGEWKPVVERAREYLAASVERKVTHG